MEIIFATGVLEEVSASADFYETEVEGLGKAFLQKLGEGIEEIKENPFLYRIIKGDIRRHLLSKFPFGIIYRIEEEKIYVVAVMHLRRKPFYWLERVKK